MEHDKSKCEAALTEKNLKANITKLTIEIKEYCKGLSDQDPRVEALLHLKTFVGLSIKHDIANPTNILNAIIARRKEDNEEYREASIKFENLIVQCLGDENADEFESNAVVVNNQLHLLVDELFPRQPSCQ